MDGEAGTEHWVQCLRWPLGGRKHRDPQFKAMSTQCDHTPSVY